MSGRSAGRRHAFSRDRGRCGRNGQHRENPGIPGLPGGNGGVGVNATRLVVRALELRILDIDNLHPDEG